MKTSENLTNLYKALCKAQESIEAVTKESINPQFGAKSKYANLTSCIQAIREPMTKHGLILMQFVMSEDVRHGIRTRLAHESGEFIETEVFCGVKDYNNPQHAGSVYTYLRRYAITAMFMLEQEDDDGKKATGFSTPEPRLVVNKTPTKPVAPKVQPSNFDAKKYLTSLNLTTEVKNMFLELCNTKKITFDDILNEEKANDLIAEAELDLAGMVM